MPTGGLVRLRLLNLDNSRIITAACSLNSLASESSLNDRVPCVKPACDASA